MAEACSLWSLLKLFVTVNNGACIVPLSGGAGSPSRRRLAAQITHTTIVLGGQAEWVRHTGFWCLLGMFYNLDRSLD